MNKKSREKQIKLILYPQIGIHQSNTGDGVHTQNVPGLQDGPTQTCAMKHVNIMVNISFAEGSFHSFTLSV